MQLLDSVYN